MKAKTAIALAFVVGGLCLATAVAHSAASTAKDDDAAIVHVLNRIGFGPRPGDVDRVRRIGLDRYIDQQLHPDRIADAGMRTRLAPLETIGLSSRAIADQYEQPVLEARRARQRQMKQDEAGADDAAKQKRNPEQRRANQVVVELAEQKVLRAVYSERQLEEVLTDFWFNHFNVDARKGADRFLLTEYEREAIRPHVLGKFRDLLGATAKSPAMLFYLDNWMSASATPAPFRVIRRRFGAPFSDPRPARAAQGKNAPKGLNENYGREVMELQTLGVDGGDTQQDVTEVARAFTGWTIHQPRQGGSFQFDVRRHDEGEKLVLGHRITRGGGIGDGEQVLDILAAHPSTAHFIATKLVRRFVSDAPPPALVDRVAARFRSTNGDLREVMRMLLTSAEFRAPDAQRAKVKTPFEFIVSAVRATGAEVTSAQPLVRAAQQLGMPLYQCQPPTGYKDTADAWVNTGALVSRMNFALQLAGNRLPGVTIDDPESAMSAVRTTMTDMSETTRATIDKAASPSQVAALTLGAPEFQRK
jgi:uncharacterized protein (DUF1800 family)